MKLKYIFKACVVIIFLQMHTFCSDPLRSQSTDGSPTSVSSFEFTSFEYENPSNTLLGRNNVDALVSDLFGDEKIKPSIFDSFKRMARLSTTQNSHSCRHQVESLFSLPIFDYTRDTTHSLSNGGILTLKYLATMHHDGHHVVDIGSDSQAKERWTQFAYLLSTIKLPAQDSMGLHGYAATLLIRAGEKRLGFDRSVITELNRIVAEHSEK